MKDKTVEEILQKSLQEAFDAECRSYANYLKIHESLFKTLEELEKKRDELKKKKELEEKVSSYKQAFNSSEFDEIKKLVNLSDSDVRNFIMPFSMYEGMSNLEGEILEITYEINTVLIPLNAFRRSIHTIQKNVNSIIKCVADANAKEISAKLRFPEENPIAERFLIIYFSDEWHFKDKWSRKVIEIEGCKLGEEFMKAYCSMGEEDEKQAYEWFVAEAKKYQI